MDPATTVNPTHKTSCGKHASQRNFGKRLIWMSSVNYFSRSTTIRIPGYLPVFLHHLAAKC